MVRIIKPSQWRCTFCDGTQLTELPIYHLCDTHQMLQLSNDHWAVRCVCGMSIPLTSSHAVEWDHWESCEALRTFVAARILVEVCG